MAVALSSTSLIAAVNVDENGVGFVGKGDVQQSYAAHHAPDPIVSTSNYIIGPSEIYAAIATRKATEGRPPSLLVLAALRSIESWQNLPMNLIQSEGPISKPIAIRSAMLFRQFIVPMNDVSLDLPAKCTL